MSRRNGIKANCALVFGTGARCFYCGDEASQIDHVLPRKHGGADQRDNLLPACKPCNSSKGGRTLEEFRLMRGAAKMGLPVSYKQYLELRAMFPVLPEIVRVEFWGELHA